MSINLFKKEFRTRLTAVLDSEREVNPKETVLDFTHAALIIHDLGFLQSAVTT